MKAISIKGRSPQEIKAALQQCITEGFRPTLAFVFLAAAEDPATVMDIMNEENIAVFGATTSENFSEKGMQDEGIVALLLDMPASCFKLAIEAYDGGEVQAAAGVLGLAGKQAFTNPAFIIATADISKPGEAVIKGILENAGGDVTIIGGVAGEHVHFTGTVFTNHSKTESGVMALVVDADKIDIKGVAVSGWKPVGTAKKITKSQGNWVYTIDDEPAMDVIRKFLGMDKLYSRMNDALDSYPLQFQREGRKPIMRPVISWNKEDNSVMLGAPVEEGSMFRFSLPPDLEVMETVIDSARKIRENDMPDADALLVFSCVGRLASFGPMAGEEIEGIAAVWNKPMAGFFSMGEYGTLEDSHPEFHGTTVSWLALKEK